MWKSSFNQNYFIHTIMWNICVLNHLIYNGSYRTEWMFSTGKWKQNIYKIKKTSTTNIYRYKEDSKKYF